MQMLHDITYCLGKKRKIIPESDIGFITPVIPEQVHFTTKKKKCIDVSKNC